MKYGTPLEKLMNRLRTPVLNAVRASQLHFDAAADEAFISSRVSCSRADLVIALRGLVRGGWLCQRDDGYALTLRGIDACNEPSTKEAA